jgi:predicted O-methyltransferase YrrM
MQPSWRLRPGSFPSSRPRALLGWLVLWTAIALLFATHHDARAQEPKKASPKGYEFTSDWFSKQIRHWRRFLRPYVGKPGLRYLEIGVFEGRSMMWMIDNVLTHPSSSVVGIDIFLQPPDLEQRYLANLARSGFKGESETLNGPSQRMLRGLEPDTFDIIYVDGSHSLDDVLMDSTLSWDLLKREGLMILDDYNWKYDLADDLRPKAAVDAFVNAFWREIQVVHKGYQFVIRKKENICDRTADTWRCSPFGPYLYIWLSKELLRAGDLTQKVELTDAEKQLIQKIINARGYGEVELRIPKETIADPTLIALRTKLGLELRGDRIPRSY